VLVWCALTEPCAQAAQDIQLIAKTYGGGVDTGGGNRPPSPASCIWDAVKAWAGGAGNPADGVHACAETIRAEQRHVQDLAYDPARKVSDTKSKHEAAIGLDLERSGKLPGPIRRDPEGRAEFIDATDQLWDIKSFNSNYPPASGGYTRSASMELISRELNKREDGKKENVILDTTNLSPQDEQDLRAAINTRPDWSGRIIWWP
jgi:hypothetical protein